MSKAEYFNKRVVIFMKITCAFIAAFAFFLVQAGFKETAAPELAKLFFFIALGCLSIGLVFDLIALFYCAARDRAEKNNE